MARLPIVEIDWVDAITRIDSALLSEAPGHCGTKLRDRHTVGYLVHQDKRRVVLASDYDDPEQDETQPTVCTFTVIPAGWVTKVDIVREATPAPEKEED